jgi:hypothetical protein
MPANTPRWHRCHGISPAQERDARSLIQSQIENSETAFGRSFCLCRLFAATHTSKLASLGRQRDAGADNDASERRAQASRRDAIDTGADDCRCFVHC